MTTRTVKIAVDRDARKRGDIHTREWTLDWDGMTDDDIRDLAADSVVIKLQQRFRDDPSGFAPDAETFRVRDVMARVARGPTEPLKRFLATIGIVVETEAEARDIVAKMAAKAKR